MKPRIWMPAMLLLVLSLPAGLMAQFPQIPGLGGIMGTGSGLSDAQIGSGLKEALSVGTEKAVKQIAKPGGYLQNQAIKILLPSSLRPVESALRAAGQGAQIDNFVASMNHAAESAAPEAAPIFASAIKSMSISDARKLLSGGDTSITDYFKSKTATQLAAAFRPHVQKAMAANDVTQKYQELAGRAPKLPFMKSPSFDIDGYVVNKALDGLFYMLGQQEKNIRTNPAARSTDLLKKVFASHS